LSKSGPNYGRRPHPARQIGYLANFFKHRFSDCGQQCNSIGCCLSLVDLSAAAALSCKQEYIYKCKQNGVILLLLLYYNKF